MLHQVIPYAFPLLEIACGVAIVVRFRGSPGAVLGGIGFGFFLASRITMKVLTALEIDWWEYEPAFILLNITGYGCLLAALITGRVRSHAQAAAGELDATHIEGRGPMSIPKLLFSFSGRIRRADIWLYQVLPTTLLYILAIVLDDGGFYLLVFLLISVPVVATNVKRCHDRDRSGWFVLIQLIPLVGMIWYFIEIGCQRGTVGPNKYGPDPLETQDMSQEEAIA